MAACSHRGCIVVAIDLEQNRLEVAEKLGADYLINGSTRNVVEELHKIAPEGADVVFESTGVPACVDPAIELCKPHGKFVYQGHYGTGPLSYRFAPPHGKRLTMFYPCDDGFEPCRRAVLKEHGNRCLSVAPHDHASRRIGGITNLLRRHQQRLRQRCGRCGNTMVGQLILPRGAHGSDESRRDRVRPDRNLCEKPVALDAGSGSWTRSMSRWRPGKRSLWQEPERYGACLHREHQPSPGRRSGDVSRRFRAGVESAGMGTASAQPIPVSPAASCQSRMRAVRPRQRPACSGRKARLAVSPGSSFRS